jgi:GTP-binding protein
VPNLGVAQWRGERSFVVADIPGLIEGAHEGAGLGHQFLRHVERCRVLVHLVEGANPDPARDPAKDFAAINRELKAHSRKLAGKPQIVAITKVDVPEAYAAGEAWRKLMARRKVPVDVHLISSATREGLDGLIDAVAGVIWSDVSPKGGGRPKKAGRPRAVAETAVSSAPARSAKPKRAAKRAGKKPEKKAAARRGKAAARPKRAAAKRSRR